MTGAIEKCLIAMDTWSLPFVWGSGFMFVLLLIATYFAFKYGLNEGNRRRRRLVKRRETAPNAVDFVLQQAEDGAIEVALSRKSIKKLSREPIEGLIQGQKDATVFRIRRA